MSVIQCSQNNICDLFSTSLTLVMRGHVYMCMESMEGRKHFVTYKNYPLNMKLL